MIKSLFFALPFMMAFQAVADLQVGDPGVAFDQNKFDPDYPQMSHWATAGVRGGIPFIHQLDIKKMIDPTNTAGIEAAIAEVSDLGGGAILLKDGTYDINSQVDMKSNVSLVGESRSGVKCIIDMNGASAFFFGEGIHDSGLYRMTIEGKWGQPEQDWNIGTNANNELPGNENVSVMFVRSIDCWVDGVDIINSADFPLRCNATHITMRDLHVDGVHNKQGGAHGYFFILDGYNLITKCYITRLRHISLQGDGVRYNVVYDNDFDQEVSFHSGDDGDNLIENNRVTIPATMPGSTPNYYAIMGPWSTKHRISARPNYLYRNTCVELNHGGVTPWSDPNVVYSGPFFVKPANPYINFTPLPADKVPLGETLYPAILGDVVIIDAEGVSVSPSSASIASFTTLALSAAVAPANASNKAVVWSSSDFSVASVDTNGVVSGVSAGVAMITATSKDGDFTASSTIEVFDLDYTISSSSGANGSVSPSGEIVVAGGSSPLFAIVPDSGYVIDKLYIDGSAVAHAGNYTFNIVTGDRTISATFKLMPASGSYNLALGKPATGTNPRTGFLAGNALDGDVSTRWTTKNYPQTIEVDLGSVMSIGRVETIWLEGRAHQYLVDVKAASGGSYAQVVDRSANVASGTPESPISDSFAAADARYVRLRVTGASGYTGEFISLMELRVFGASGGVAGETEPQVSVNPIDDAYLQGSARYDTPILRLESGNRVSYLKFDVSGVTGAVTGAKLNLLVAGDAGSGTIRVYKGNGNAWTESDLSTSNAPTQGEELGSVSGVFALGSPVSIDLSPNVGVGLVSLIVKMDAGGNDVSFSSSEGSAVPSLEVKYNATPRESQNTSVGGRTRR